MGQGKKEKDMIVGTQVVGWGGGGRGFMNNILLRKWGGVISLCAIKYIHRHRKWHLSCLGMEAIVPCDTTNLLKTLCIIAPFKNAVHFSLIFPFRFDLKCRSFPPSKS